MAVETKVYSNPGAGRVKGNMSLVRGQGKWGWHTNVCGLPLLHEESLTNAFLFIKMSLVSQSFVLWKGQKLGELILHLLRKVTQELVNKYLSIHK